MPRIWPFGIVLALSVWLVPGSRADVVFVDQPNDFRGFSPSEEGTAVPSARTADDYFNMAGKSFITSITVWMVVSFPNMPESFVLERYAGVDAPEALVDTFPMLSATDLGEWNGRNDLHLVEVSFDPMDRALIVGRLWLSPYAIGNGSGTDRAWWATSERRPRRNGLEAHFISDHFGVPDWTPISDSGILDFPSDFAMRIEALLPAPGGIAVLCAGLSVKMRRRRLS